MTICILLYCNFSINKQLLEDDMETSKNVAVLWETDIVNNHITYLLDKYNKIYKTQGTTYTKWCPANW